MNNQINSTPSFSGNFIVRTAAKNSDRISNIQKLFKESTKDMPNDTLSLKFNSEDKYEFLETGKNTGTIFAIREGFNSWLDNFQMVKFLKN